MAPQAVHALKHKLNGLTTSDEPFHVHPLAQLRSPEIDVARQVVTKARSACLLLFRDIFTEEPKKAELVPFLNAEHSGQLSDETPRPPRLARVQYDTIGEDGSHAYTESVINIHTREEVVHRIVDKDCQPPLTLLVKQSHHLIILTEDLAPSSRLSKMPASNHPYGRRLWPNWSCQTALVRYTITARSI
jgi:hypothetical protein